MPGACRGGSRTAPVQLQPTDLAIRGKAEDPVPILGRRGAEENIDSLQIEAVELAVVFFVQLAHDLPGRNKIPLLIDGYRLLKTCHLPAQIPIRFTLAERLKDVHRQFFALDPHPVDKAAEKIGTRRIPG